MRVIVDCLAATSGGIATVAEGLLGAWSAVAPDDDVHVVVQTDKLRLPDDGFVQTHYLRVPAPDLVWRPILGSRAIARLVRDCRADVVLTINPAAPIGRVRAPIVIAVEDLRHELQPEQFTGFRRLARRMAYGWGYRVAAGALCISERTRVDLLRLHPSLSEAIVRVVYLGADHVLRWERDPIPRGGAVAFAHHNNKRVEMVIEAWAQLSSLPGLPKLHIVGLGDGRAARLETLIAERSLSDRIALMPFLPAAAFERLMTGAELIVFPSDFEGFGLPAVEAMTLGIPVVVGPDPAVVEVTAGLATTMTEWTTVSLVEALSRALAQPQSTLESAKQHAGEFTWMRAVKGTRSLLLEVLADVSHTSDRSPSE